MFFDLPQLHPFPTPPGAQLVQVCFPFHRQFRKQQHVVPVFFRFFPFQPQSFLFLFHFFSMNGVSCFVVVQCQLCCQFISVVNTPPNTPPNTQPTTEKNNQQPLVLYSSKCSHTPKHQRSTEIKDVFSSVPAVITTRRDHHHGPTYLFARNLTNFRSSIVNSDMCHNCPLKCTFNESSSGSMYPDSSAPKPSVWCINGSCEQH